MDSDGTSWNQGEDLISQRYDINSQKSRRSILRKSCEGQPARENETDWISIEKVYIYIYALKYIESANTIAEC